MSELIEKLGLDWKLLLAQAVNFVVILVILRFTAYKPIVDILRKRRETIEKGIADARLADEKLMGADVAYKERLAEAEKESLQTVADAELRAKTREGELLAVAKEKETAVLASAEKQAEARKQEAEARIYDDAVDLVRAAMSKTVELSPEKIDTELIEQAVASLKKTT